MLFIQYGKPSLADFSCFLSKKFTLILAVNDTVLGNVGASPANKRGEHISDMYDLVVLRSGWHFAWVANDTGGA